MSGIIKILLYSGTCQGELEKNVIKIIFNYYSMELIISAFPKLF